MHKIRGRPVQKRGRVKNSFPPEAGNGREAGEKGMG
jgi:hypothetical protein